MVPATARAKRICIRLPVAKVATVVTNKMNINTEIKAHVIIETFFIDALM